VAAAAPFEVTRREVAALHRKGDRPLAFHGSHHVTFLHRLVDGLTREPSFTLYLLAQPSLYANIPSSPETSSFQNFNNNNTAINLQDLHSINMPRNNVGPGFASLRVTESTERVGRRRGQTRALAAQARSFQFFALPPEIRHMIYGHIPGPLGSMTGRRLRPISAEEADSGRQTHIDLAVAKEVCENMKSKYGKKATRKWEKAAQRVHDLEARVAECPLPLKMAMLRTCSKAKNQMTMFIVEKVPVSFFVRRFSSFNARELFFIRHATRIYIEYW
jgi:hypothetical protein